MMKVLIYISPYSFSPTMYTDLSCKTSPTTGMLWLKPEQKLMLPCLNVPTCKAQKHRCWLMRRWAIPAAGVGPCGRWAGHTASTSNCFQPAWRNPLLGMNQLPGVCVNIGTTEVWFPVDLCLMTDQLLNWFLLTKFYETSWQVRGTRSCFQSPSISKTDGQIKTAIPYHNTISTQSLNFLVKLSLKPHVLLWCYIIPDINSYFSLFSTTSAIFSESEQPLNLKNSMVGSLTFKMT